MADVLQRLALPTIALLVGFVVVVFVLDLVITAAIAKWAIFAPVFVPLLMQLGVAPEAVLAAYRVGDSPMNAITPLNAYFAMIVTFAIKYQKEAGVGTGRSKKAAEQTAAKHLAPSAGLGIAVGAASRVGNRIPEGDDHRSWSRTQHVDPGDKRSQLVSRDHWQLRCLGEITRSRNLQHVGPVDMNPDQRGWVREMDEDLDQLEWVDRQPYLVAHQRRADRDAGRLLARKAHRRLTAAGSADHHLADPNRHPTMVVGQP